jgi:hydroxyacylglutathione hydrolase
MTHPLGQGDQVQVPELGLALAVIDVPGHTAGHIAYHAARPGWLFCGDTLFAGGCGRLFEGTPAQMADSLGKLAALPDSTAVYCAHEYTLANLKFALAVEPGNQTLQARFQAESAKRERHEPTIPSTVAIERATNPFLRYTEPAIIAKLFSSKHVSSREPIACFAALREWKNSFR